MKKRFVCFLLVLMTLLGLGASAYAAETSGNIYDETDELLSGEGRAAGEKLRNVAGETGVAAYIDIYTSLGAGKGLEEAAKNMYVNSGFGYGDSKRGLLLALYVKKEGDGWALDAEEPFGLYCNELPYGLKEELLLALEPLLSDSAWSGSLDEDRCTVEKLSAVLADTVLNFGKGAELQPDAGVVNVPFEGQYLIDRYALLTPAEQENIEALAARYSEKHGCGIYVMLLDDYKQLNGNSEIFKANYTYYHDHNMGWGEGRDGVFLLLSMSERDFSFFVYGEKASYALDSWGQIKLEKAFIDDLREDRWYDGLKDFADTCDEFLSLAEAGKPVRRSPALRMILSTAISAAAAYFSSKFLWDKNKKPYRRGDAEKYVVPGTFVPGRYEERHIGTKVRTRVVQASSDTSSSFGSSTAHVGGGGSGRSGKF